MSNNHAGYAVDAVAFVNQLDRKDEVEVEGRVLLVQTKNSRYVVDAQAGTIKKNDGPALEGFVNGSTFGGSMLLMGRVLPGAFMEFGIKGQGIFTTTEVQSVEVLA